MNQEEGGGGGEEGGGRELPNGKLTSGNRIFRDEPSEHNGSQREDWRCVCPDSRSVAGKCEERRRMKSKRIEHREKKQQKVRAKVGGLYLWPH